MARKPIKFAEVEAQIKQLHGSVSQVAGWYRDSGDYTPEGRAAKYAAALDDKRFNYRGKAQQLSQLIDNLTPAAQAKVAQARAKVMPVAKDPTEQLAAELQAQRLMNRPGLKQTDIMKLVREADPSPGLTLAVEEWQARGQLGEDFTEATLSAKSPEYEQAQAESRQVYQLAGFLKQRLDKTVEQMDTTREVDTRVMPDVEAVVNDGWVAGVDMDDVPSGAFGEVTVDPVYRNA